MAPTGPARYKYEIIEEDERDGMIEGKVVFPEDPDENGNVPYVRYERRADISKELVTYFHNVAIHRGHEFLDEHYGK